MEIVSEKEVSMNSENKLDNTHKALLDFCSIIDEALGEVDRNYLNEKIFTEERWVNENGGLTRYVRLTEITKKGLAFPYMANFIKVVNDFYKSYSERGFKKGERAKRAVLDRFNLFIDQANKMRSKENDGN